jgi:hypothetical protein
MKRRAVVAGAVSAAVAIAAASGGVLAGCAGTTSGQHQAGSAPGSAGPLYSPFTGERVARLHTVLALKIDNIVYARPQTGLTHADIIYVEPVEGGLSRFLAVFSSHVPRVIGPVRSARAEDLQILSQFGRPAFAWSGAQPHLVPVVEHAHVVDLYAGIVGGYFRGTNRIAPYNLYAQTSQLLAESRRASIAHDIGFRFGAAPAGGKPTGSISVHYPSASFSFRWTPVQHRWRVWMDGAPARTTDAGQMGPPTVVIQYVHVGRSERFLEHGSPPPYAETIGHGTALVLRDGRAYRVHWSRPAARGGTTYTLPNGQRMTFARGQVWVVLAFGPGSTWHL